MEPNIYKILQRCVEEGARYGYRRAFKHTNDPTEDAIIDSVILNVMNEITEWFDFNTIKDEE